MHVYILYVYYDYISKEEVAHLTQVSEDIGASLILFDTRSNNEYFEFTGFSEALNKAKVKEGVTARYIFINSSFFKNHMIPSRIVSRVFVKFPYEERVCYGILNKSFKNRLLIERHVSTWFFMVDSSNAKEIQFIPDVFNESAVFGSSEWPKVQSWLLSKKIWWGYPGIINRNDIARKKCTISLEYMFTKMLHNKNFIVKKICGNDFISFTLLIDRVLIKCRRFLLFFRS